MTPAPTGRWRRRAATLFLFLILVAAGLLIYLKTAPPPLDFLKETLETRVARSFPGVRIQIGAIRMDWPFWRIDPRIRLTGLVVSDPDRPAAPAAGCDRVDLTLSIADLLKRRIVPKRIALIRPHLDLSAVDHPAAWTPSPSGRGSLPFRTLRIEDGLLLPRTDGDAALSIPEARLDATSTGMRLTLSATQSGKTVDVDARRRHTDSGASQWDVAFVGLRPTMLSALSDGFAHLAGIRLPLKGRLLARLAPDGGPIRFDLALDGAAGRLSYPWLERDLPVRKLSAEMTWAAPGPLFLESATLDFEGPTFHAAGPIAWEDGPPTLALSLRAEDIDIADLSSYWPPPAEPDVRQWHVDHFISGRAAGAEAEVWLTPDDFRRCRIPCDALSATVDFSDLVLDYFPPMPRLRGASGRAVFTACGVEIAVENGLAANSRTTGGAVRIMGFADHPTQMEIDARVVGPAADLFNAVSDLELDDWAPLFRVTGGRADTRLGFDFPLQDDFDPEAFQVFVDARGKGLDLETAWGLPLARGEASVRYEDEKLEAHGTAYLNDVPLAINWERDRLDAPGKDAVLTVTGAPDRKAFAAWGLPPPEGIDGPVPTTANLKITEEETRAEARFDLSGAALGIRPLGWEKTPGENAALALKLAWTTPDVIRLDRIHFHGTDFQILGSGLVGTAPPAPLWRLDLERVHLGANRLSAAIRHTAAGYDVVIEGPLFNAMPLLNADMLASEGAVADVPLDLRLKADRILLKNGVELQGAAGRYRRGRNSGPSVSLKGVTGPEKPVELALVPVADGHRLLVAADDAGALVKGLDLYTHASDGALTADFFLAAGTPPRISGSLKATSFTLREAPTLVDLLSLASLEGIVKGLRREGTPFEILDVRLSMADGVVDIREGKMEGDALGITFSGRYDAKDRQMDIDGIVVPFNLINRAFHAVPLVGKMIAGDGIIAVSYRLRGDPASPAIIVNPMSTLLVGPLRNLFDRLDPGGDTD
jgi:hypothetical protein